MGEVEAVEATVRAFYTAVLRDQDYPAARRFASPDFHLKPSLYIGFNIDAWSETTLTGRPSRRRARRRDCAALARTIFEARGDLYPFRAWEIDSVELDPDGTTAHVVSSDGSCGLEKRNGRWLMLWAFDA